jgi:hypothetical protein
VRRNTEEDFWARVDKSGGPDACWPWLGSFFPGGYGQFRFVGVGLGAHVFAFKSAYGYVPAEGRYVCHSCDFKPCCNPAHLFDWTSSQNVRDMHIKGRARDNRGSTNPCAKLTEGIVVAIRARRGEVQQRLADEFGVTQSIISEVLARKIWRHV